MVKMYRLHFFLLQEEKKSAEDLRRRQLVNIFNFAGWLHAETLKEVNYNCHPVQAAEVDFSGLDLSFVQVECDFDG